MGTGDHNAGGGGGAVTLCWTTIPSRGSDNIPSHFMLQKPELTASTVIKRDIRL